MRTPAAGAGVRGRRVSSREETIVVTFIVRRLIATVFLLIVVSMITYAVFFLIPRLAGQNAYQQINQVYATLTSHTDPLFRSMADGLAGLDRT